MGKKLGLHFAAGLATGLADGYRRNQELAARDEDRKMRKDEHDVRMADVEEKRQDKIALKNALQPVTMEEGAGGMTKAPAMDNRDVGLPENAALPNGGLQEGGFQVQGKSFTERAPAEIALKQANSPEAKAGRVATALESRGKPTEAMQFQEQAEKFANSRFQGQLRTAMQGGHEGLAKLVTETEGGVFSGKKLKPVVSPDGKQVTYHAIGEDGREVPTKLTFANDQNGVIQAAYMLDKAVPLETRYRNMVDEDKRSTAAAVKERELGLRERTLNEVTIPVGEARIALSEARATAAEAKSARGGDGVSREERLRWTTLHSEAGRRMSEANKAFNTLSSDAVFMAKARKPGTPEAQQLASLQSDIEAYKDDRATYGGLLAGSQGKEAKEARAAAKTPAAGKAEPKAGGVATPTSKADYDALPPGAKYRHPDGDVRIKK